MITKSWHTYGVGKKQCENGEKPKLKENIDVSKYDVIFVGTPAWWHDMAPAVKTFLSSNNFNGKTVIPFITHGGGGKYAIKENIETMAVGAKVLVPFVVSGDCGSSLDNKLSEWLKTLNLE